ncbi:hypothetical protein IEO21_07174 [Rhodonia placenta]|uniref:Uncharacterized protein n=1 Tax=Rhodonia placenta TaxID=104341 RepID=A0A8H7NZ26_9APHY|nr:hypothetical protein IEO21_07174 [Postia placenta]
MQPARTAPRVAPEEEIEVIDIYLSDILGRLVRFITYLSVFCVICYLSCQTAFVALPVISAAMYAFYHPMFAHSIIGGMSATIYTIPYVLTVVGFYRIWHHDMRSPALKRYPWPVLASSLLADAANTVRVALVLAPILVFLSGHGFDHYWQRAADDASLAGQLAATILHCRVMFRWMPVAWKGFDLKPPSD